MALVPSPSSPDCVVRSRWVAKESKKDWSLVMCLAMTSAAKIQPRGQPWADPSRCSNHLREP